MQIFLIGYYTAMMDYDIALGKDRMESISKAVQLCGKLCIDMGLGDITDELLKDIVLFVKIHNKYTDDLVNLGKYV